MKAAKHIALMLVLLLASGITALAETGNITDPDEVMEAASKAIDEGELDQSMARLEGIQEEGLSDDSLSRLHFLKGKVTYIKVSSDIKACRAEGTQKRFELQEHQIGPLDTALDHMKKSYELATDSDWAPEALYAAGLIQDSGCLQRFGGAMDSYKTLMEKYPSTNLGKAARQKYHYLKARMDQKGHGKTHP